MDSTTTVYVLVAILIVAVLIAALLATRRRRTRRLRTKFGPEYDHAIVHDGGRGKAEAALEARERHVQKLTIRALAPAERDFYLNAWNRAQAAFVDDPAGSIAQADQLVGVVMSTRGYPVSDFEQRAADISVENPLIVQHYRAGHALTLRCQGGAATTEDLRQAMIHYRALFDDLVGIPGAVRTQLAS
ncbi:MAG: hypothetical protein JO303_00385 [Caulobacteraceae bacterium]|nr:hypothetical protein [Caulobacteraceae bacterium]